MTALALTGADGFLGWHTQVLARTGPPIQVRPIRRQDMADPRRLARQVGGAEHVIHIAGVNRADDRGELTQNVDLARRLSVALLNSARPPRTLTFANSTQRNLDNPYGRSKARAALVLADTCQGLGIDFHDVALPNLFGEHGRPNYNSVVATFCGALARDLVPRVHEDRQLSLLAVRDASAQLLAAALGQDGVGRATTEITVSDLLATLVEFSGYFSSGEIPSLADRFHTQLFNALRAAGFPHRYPIPLVRRSDPRGDLVETVRVRGGGGQAFLSTTRPGATRGQHFHLDKIERFVVVQGQATVSLRRLLTDDVISFEVTGEEPVIIDMPTLWTHSITNTGTGLLYTQFWTDQLFDPASPDTYPEQV
jgi:UDP-2-acetamido-2,6-beta-L-arabino-hexul-4-ose reductase